mgnify:CR=1 FL=1
MRRFHQRVRIQFQLPGALKRLEPPGNAPLRALREGARQCRACPGRAGEGNQGAGISAADGGDHPGPAPTPRRGARDAEFKGHFLPFNGAGQPAQQRAVLHPFRQMQQQIQHAPPAHGARQQFRLAQARQAFNGRQQPGQLVAGFGRRFGAG